jgi:hypothetical protein
VECGKISTFAPAKVVIALALGYQYAEKERFTVSDMFSETPEKEVRLHLFLSVCVDCGKQDGT